MTEAPKPKTATALRFILVVMLLAVCANAAQDKPLVCGIASGFPPYQFVHDGHPAGFDADVARALATKMGRVARFEQDSWDTVLNMLRFGRVDIIVGMEVNDFRKEYFDFSVPYATRHDAVFVLANSTLDSVSDLFGRVITGDRHSFIELLWKEQGFHGRIRITQTKTKEESLAMLGRGQVEASIMPEQVGWYLAREAGLEVRVLSSPDPGSDVAVALRKGSPDMMRRIDEALDDIRVNGELDALKRKWFGTGDNRKP